MLSILVLIVMSMSIMSIRVSWVLSAIAGGMLELWVSYSQSGIHCGIAPQAAPAQSHFQYKSQSFSCQLQLVIQHRQIIDQPSCLLLNGPRYDIILNILNTINFHFIQFINCFFVNIHDNKA